MSESIYKKVKEIVPVSDEGQFKSVISEQDFLLFNRKDYYLTQISPSKAFFDSFKGRYAYTDRTYLGMVDGLLQFIDSSLKMRILILDPEELLTAFFIYLRSSSKDIVVYAPKGVNKFEMKPPPNALIPFAKAFQEKLLTGESAINHTDSDGGETFILASSKKSNYVISAVNKLEKIDRAVLCLKNYSLLGNYDEREYLEDRGIFVTTTFEGHAFYRHAKY